jgi:hypothetical protein
MQKKFDPTKPVQTRDGWGVVIFPMPQGAAGYNKETIFGAYKNPDLNCWYVACWSGDGRWNGSTDTEYDLVNIPAKKSGWLNIYPTATKTDRIANIGGLYFTKDAADKGSGGSGLDRIACIEVHWEE